MSNLKKKRRKNTELIETENRLVVARGVWGGREMGEGGQK